MIDKFLNMKQEKTERMKSHIGKEEMPLIFLNIREYDI